MRNRVHKFCGVLVAALLPAAAGCTAYSVRYDEAGGNPPYARGEHDYPPDGAQAGTRVRHESQTFTKKITTPRAMM